MRTTIAVSLASSLPTCLLQTALLLGVALPLGLAAPAAAQELSAAERSQALGRVRSFAECVERQHQQLERVMQLIRESEQQRDRARDARVREDAERALEALVARAADIQRDVRSCLGEDLPSPGTRVIERGPPPDPAAEAVAETGGTVRVIERDARLTDTIRVVRGEQVDGQGRLDAAAVRSAVRGVSSELGRCYERYLERGSLAARELNLVFTVRGAGRPQRVVVERSGFRDPGFERCVEAAGRRLRMGSAPRGGEAVYSYTLRFGRGER